MQAAFAWVGVLDASGAVHEGWIDPPASGRIAWKQQPAMGYHAFAIVAYDGDGFWLQNSWGDAWGRKGFARISYDEWLERDTDAWVARSEEHTSELKTLMRIPYAAFFLKKKKNRTRHN